jgi:hypothetical protein
VFSHRAGYAREISTRDKPKLEKLMGLLRVEQIGWLCEFASFPPFFRLYKDGGLFHSGFSCHLVRYSVMVPDVKELWEQALLPYNLPLTLLLGLAIGFWILTLLGAVSADADLPSGDDWLGDVGDLPSAMLRVVNAGSVPVTVVLTVLILVMWISSLLLNYYLNPGASLLLAGGLFLAAFVLGVIGTKVITQPLVPFMRRLKAAENAPPVIGEVGVVRSIQLDPSYGQVEVERQDGASALLNARLSADAEPIPRGTSVAIISCDEKSGVYLVRPLPPPPFID